MHVAETTPAVGSQTTVLGWGNMEPFSDQPVQQPNILQAADVTVRALEVCRTPMLANREICAGDPDEGTIGWAGIGLCGSRRRRGCYDVDIQWLAGRRSKTGRIDAAATTRMFRVGRSRLGP